MSDVEIETEKREKMTVIAHHLSPSPILLCADDKFVDIQDDFIHKYVDLFEDTDENKLEYTGVFKQWVLISLNGLGGE